MNIFIGSTLHTMSYVCFFFNFHFNNLIDLSCSKCIPFTNNHTKTVHVVVNLYCTDCSLGFLNGKKHIYHKKTYIHR